MIFFTTEEAEDWYYRYVAQTNALEREEDWRLERWLEDQQVIDY